jgi:hypothetical protein
LCARLDAFLEEVAPASPPCEPVDQTAAVQGGWGLGRAPDDPGLIEGQILLTRRCLISWFGPR